MAIFALARLFARARLSAARINKVRSEGRQSLKRARGSATGRYAQSASVLEELAEEAAELYAEAFNNVEESFYEALIVMAGMTANAGQDAVFDQYVVDAFAEAVASSDPESGTWQDVDIGEYMAFMGIIVETGNDIMQEAYAQAQSLIADAQELEFIAEQIATEFLKNN